MTTQKDTPLLFSTPSYGYLKQALLLEGAFEEGAVETRTFPDGERYQRILNDVRGRDVILLGGTVSDGETLRIFDLACALVKYGARSLTLTIPFYGYATMERAMKSGEVVTAKTRARLISAIPKAPTGNRLVLMDLHTAGIPYYFEGDIHAWHLYAKPVILDAARALGAEESGFVLACTDAGRAKWVESLANDLGVEAAFVFKRRLGDTQTEISGISADVDGKRVVIYDDMIRSGSSLMGAARAYLDAGADQVSAITTHGLFPGQALQKIKDSGLIKRIICTDTHPRAHDLADGVFLEAMSVARVLYQHLAR